MTSTGSAPARTTRFGGTRSHGRRARVAVGLAMVALGSLGSALGFSDAATAQSSRSSTPLKTDVAIAVPRNQWFTVGGSPLDRVLRQVRGFSACVRRNGIPNLPNPRVSGSEILVLLPRGLARGSSRVKKAARACEKLSPLPPGALTRSSSGDDGPSTSTSGG
jgi:hypothetical protein